MTVDHVSVCTELPELRASGRFQQLTVPSHYVSLFEFDLLSCSNLIFSLPCCMPATGSQPEHSDGVCGSIIASLRHFQACFAHQFGAKNRVAPLRLK